MRLPAPGGDPYNYPGHSGIDFLRGPAWFGRPFYASGPGRVVRLSRNAAGGCWIIVKYDAIPYEVGYAHMVSHAGCPAPGARVREGTMLGYVGNLGTNVTGPHIHLEILGRATPDAVWQYFDRNRVVSQGATAGEQEEQEDMALDPVTDYHAFASMLQRALKFDVRPSGLGATHTLGPTVWERLNSIESAANTPITDAQIKVIADAVAAQVGKSDVSIDYDRIADAVREKFSSNPLK